MDLSPDWVVGFVDGEGCFFVGISKHPQTATGYQVLPEFVVVQHERDIQILYALKRFFRCGVVRRNHGDRWAYRVRGLDNLERIVAFFEQHPLKTKKRVDFIKFRRILHLMKQGAHLTHEGLLEIVRIVRQMNTANRPKLDEILREAEAGRRDGPPHGESHGER